MASVQDWSEWNGTNGGSESITIGYLGWMSSDTPDTTGVIYNSNPITAGQNSFVKYQSLCFDRSGNWPATWRCPQRRGTNVFWSPNF